MESLFRVRDCSRPWNYNECNRKNHRRWEGGQRKRKPKKKKMMCSINKSPSWREKSSKAEEVASRAGTVFSRHIGVGLGVWLAQMRENVLVTQGILGQRRGCLGRNHLVGSGNYQVVAQGNWELEGEQGQEVGSDLPGSQHKVSFWCPFPLSSCYKIIVQVLGHFLIDISYIASLLSQLYTYAEF